MGEKMLRLVHKVITSGRYRCEDKICVCQDKIINKLSDISEKRKSLNGVRAVLRDMWRCRDKMTSQIKTHP